MQLKLASLLRGDSYQNVMYLIKKLCNYVAGKTQNCTSKDENQIEEQDTWNNAYERNAN